MFIMLSDVAIRNKGKTLINSRKNGPWKIAICNLQGVLKALLVAFSHCVPGQSMTLTQNRFAGPIAMVTATDGKYKGCKVLPHGLKTAFPTLLREQGASLHPSKPRPFTGKNGFNNNSSFFKGLLWSKRESLSTKTAKVMC